MFEQHTFSPGYVRNATLQHWTLFTYVATQRNASISGFTLLRPIRNATLRISITQRNVRSTNWWFRIAQLRHIDIQEDTYATQRCRKRHWSIPSHYNATQRNIKRIHFLPDDFSLSRNTHYYHDECKIRFTWHSSRDLTTQACLY